LSGLGTRSKIHIFDGAFNIPNALDARGYDLGAIIMKTRMIIRREKGAAALEFAIVLPVLVLLALGICQFGILFYNQQVIINASREAARAGIVQRTHDDGSQYETWEIEAMLDGIVQNYVSGRLITIGGGGTLGVASDGVKGNFGEDLWVAVTYDYQFFGDTSFFGLKPDYTLRGETHMNMEQVLASGS
jgi:hypothetical protein